MNIVYVSPFSHNGFASVQRDDRKWNFMDKDGNIISTNQWFRLACNFRNDGFARIQREDYKWNFIDTNGNILSTNQWFVYVGCFNNDIASVKREDGLWNMIDIKGNILSPNLWFDYTNPHMNAFKAHLKMICIILTTKINHISLSYIN